MQSFTKNEINWVIGELDKLACQMQQLSTKETISKIEQGICSLRSEQFQSIANRLSLAIEENNKRIEIKY